MRLLVCGSRGWLDVACVRRHLFSYDPSVIIHGGCPRGADNIADLEAGLYQYWENKALVIDVYPANPHVDGPWPAAGPRRNARMLRDAKPDRGLAFGALYRHPDAHGSAPLPSSNRATGTGSMVRLMLTAGLPVRWVPSPTEPAQDLTAMPPPPVRTSSR